MRARSRLGGSSDVLADQLTLPEVIAGLRRVRLVGQGGEGQVWEVRTAAGERRAMKLVRPEAMASPPQVARRGDWLRRIDHPSLVRVRRAGRLGGRWAPEGLVGWGLVEMDFVDGTDLSSTPAISYDRAAAVLTPLAAGLDDLHAGRWSDGVPLVHRDVKPANLVRGHDGRVVLVDCSSLCGLDRTVLTRIGTPVFAAPEVTTGRIGPPADAYALAATVVALVTGERGGSLAALLDAPWRLDLPQAVGAALDPDPRRRPHRCVDVVAPAGARGHAHPWLPALHGGEASHDQPSLPAPAVASTAPAAAPDFTPPAPPRVPHAWLPVAAPDAPPALPDAPSALPDAPSALPVGLGSARLATVDDGTPLVPEPPLRSAVPLLVIVGAIVGLLVGSLAQPTGAAQSWVVAAAALSVVAHHAFGVGPARALLAPTASWAFLIAERATCDAPRRAWVRTTATGALTGAAFIVGAGIVQSGAAESFALAAVMGAAALLGCAAAVAVARRPSPRTAWLRAALVPATLFGIVLLVVGAVVSLPGALVGRGDRPRWLAAEAARAFRGALVGGGPDPRRPPGTVRDPALTEAPDHWSRS